MITCVNTSGFSPNLVCIDIMEIWFEIVDGQISSIFDRVVCPPHVRNFIPDDNLSKYQLTSAKLGMCIDIMEVWFGIANGQIFISF